MPGVWPGERMALIIRPPTRHSCPSCTGCAVPIIPLAVRVPYLGPGNGGKLDGPAQIVFIPVGLEDMPDAHTLPGGLFRVDEAIPSRVDDGRCASCPDQVRIMGKAFRFDALKSI